MLPPLTQVVDLGRPGGPLLLQRPDDEALETGEIIPVLSYAGDNRDERAKKETCPSCGTQDSIRYLGSSVATLLSVALSNLFGEPELDDADKKTLVFTDSVQDAAHRAASSSPAPGPSRYERGSVKQSAWSRSPCDRRSTGSSPMPATTSAPATN